MFSHMEKEKERNGYSAQCERMFFHPVLNEVISFAWYNESLCSCFLVWLRMGRPHMPCTSMRGMTSRTLAALDGDVMLWFEINELWSVYAEWEGARLFYWCWSIKFITYTASFSMLYVLFLIVCMQFGQCIWNAWNSYVWRVGNQSSACNLSCRNKLQIYISRALW